MALQWEVVYLSQPEILDVHESPVFTLSVANYEER